MVERLGNRVTGSKQTYAWLRNFENHQVIIRQGLGSEATSYYTGKVVWVNLPLVGEKQRPCIVLEDGRIVPYDIDITAIDLLK